MSGPGAPPASLAGEALRRGTLRLAASFRFGRARGAFCHAGWCQQCKVALADGRVGLACRMDASEIALLRPPRRTRPLAGRVAEALRPWFHERVVLSGRAQQAFLRMLRRASGALPLPAGPVAPGGPLRTLSCDCLVVGLGVSGSAAAEALAQAGRDVLGIDEQELDRAGDGRRLPGSVALGLYPDAASPSGHALLAAGPTGPVRILFRALVAATGAYERLPPVPGCDLPGIVGVTAFARLARAGAIGRERVIGLYAGRDGAARAAAAARQAGLRFRFAVGSTDPAADLAEAVHPGRFVAGLAGRGRLRVVALSDGTRHACDLLVVGYLQPSYELAMQAGRRAALPAPLAALATEGEAAFPFLAVGGAAGDAGPDRAMRSRQRVTAFLAGRTLEETRPEAMPGPSRIADAVIACPCEDVRVGDLRAAIAAGFDTVEHLKRRTGAGTGPCQGKLCHGLMLGSLAEAGAPVALPTVRPLLRPVALAALGAAEP